MAELSDMEFILQMAREVVAEVAPEELASFPLMAEAYMQSSKRMLTSKASGKVGLGMGAGELIATWTPTILLLLQQAVLQGGKDAVAEESKTLFTGIFRRARGLWQTKGKKQEVTLPTRGHDLSREDLQTLRTFFYETALEYDVEDAKAQQIAVCVVGKWATRQVIE